MAKKNVFPVCNPNVLEFSPENSIFVYENLSASATYRLFHTDGSWGQLLIGEAGQEEWTRDGAIQGRGVFIFGFHKGQNGTPVLDSPPSGTVICVGIKNKLTSTYDTHFLSSRTYSPVPRSISFDFGVSFDESRKDSSDQSVVYANSFWVTYMWDGSTWQMLGSNNWV